MSTRSSNAATNRVTRSLSNLVAESALIIVRSALWVGFTTAGIALNMWGALMLLLLLTPSNVWAYLATVFGAVIVGCIGGVLTGMGQVLALRRWLDGAATLGSFLSTVLASSAALGVGTGVGWWMHTVAGDLAGVIMGLVAYGSVFGLIQRPMVDYMARYSLLWVPINAAAAILGAMALLAAFDVSGGRRDTLQFRYVGLVYAIVTGISYLWMTRQTRRAMAIERRSSRVSGQPAPFTLQSPGVMSSGVDGTERDADLLQIHEYRVFTVREVPHDEHAGGPSGANPVNSGDAPDIIDTTFRVLS